MPELVAIHWHLRGTLTPAERAVVRRGMGGAAMRISLGRRRRDAGDRGALRGFAPRLLACVRATRRGRGRARRRAAGPAAHGVPEFPSQPPAAGLGHRRHRVRGGRPRPRHRRAHRGGPRVGDARRHAAGARARLAARGAERPAPRPARNREGAARRSGRRGGAEARLQRSGGARRDPVGAERDRPRRRRRGRDPGGRPRRRRARDPPARRLGRGGHSPPPGGRDNWKPSGQRGSGDAKDAATRTAGSTHAATLRAALGDRSADVRAAVLQEAATLPPGDAAGIVTLALRDPDPALRRRAEEATEALAAREPAAVVAALADLLQGGDAGARRAALVLFESIAARAPAASAPVLGRVVLAERTPDDARVAALVILRRTGPPLADAAPGAGEGDPAGVLAAPSRGGAAAVRAARFARRGGGDRAQRDEGPPGGPRVGRRRVGRGRGDAPGGSRQGAEGDALRSVDGDPRRSGARVRLPEARGTRSRGQGAQGSEPGGRAGGAGIGVGAGGGVPLPGRRDPRPCADDRAAGGAAQPDRNAGPAGRGSDRGGAGRRSRARSRTATPPRASRRRTGSARSPRRTRPPRRLTCASPRRTTATTSAPRPPRVWPTSPPATRRGRRASSPSWPSRRSQRSARPPPTRWAP